MRTHVSLFAGIDAIGIAAEQHGYTTTACVEIDPYCRQVLANRLPGAALHEDVRTVGAAELLRYPYKMPASKLSCQDMTDAIAEYQAGASLEQIADHLPITRQALWERFRSRGIKMRPQTRRGPENHFYRGGPRGADWAHNKVERALRTGELVKPDACSSCGGAGQPYKDGRSPIHAHHDDYNTPLAIRWLCQGCHHAWHTENEPVALREEVMLAEIAREKKIDLLSGGFP